MKKYVLIALSALIVLSFSSCASRSSIKTAEEYLSEFYQNANQGNYTACYYQLNKNSAEQIEAASGINAEDFIGARSLILGPVVNYEITDSKYSKNGEDKLVDFNVHVEYERAAFYEKMQVIIKKDGQTSINSVEWGNEEITAGINDEYLQSLTSDNVDNVVRCFSPYYFESKTERNITDMINQANNLGGDLGNCEIIDGEYIYEPMETGTFVYKAFIRMDYENIPMVNTIKIVSQDGNLGVGYSVIAPEKISILFDDYLTQLNAANEEGVLGLYSDDFWGGSEDNKETWWRRLQMYNEEYGQLLGYEVTSIGFDTMEGDDGEEINIVRLDMNMQYQTRDVKNSFVLADGDIYKIIDHYVSDE